MCFIDKNCNTESKLKKMVRVPLFITDSRDRQGVLLYKFFFLFRNLIFEPQNNFSSFLRKRKNVAFLGKYCQFSVKAKNSNGRPIPTRISGNAHGTQVHEMTPFEAKNPTTSPGQPPEDFSNKNFNFQQSISVAVSN